MSFTFTLLSDGQQIEVGHALVAVSEDLPRPPSRQRVWRGPVEQARMNDRFELGCNPMLAMSRKAFVDALTAEDATFRCQAPVNCNSSTVRKPCR